MIVDSHLHYFQPPSKEHPRDPLGQSSAPPMLLEDLMAQVNAAGIDKIVQVTPSDLGYDNWYSLHGAERFPDRIRVFGRFDAQTPGSESRLADWAAQKHMVGVRLTIFPHMREWFDNSLNDPFWARAAELRVPISIYAPERLRQVGKIAGQHPRLQFIIDHMGAIFFQGDDPFAHQPELLALAATPNVAVKLSGVNEFSKGAFPFEDVHPFVQAVYARFGAERILWGSNYPPSARKSPLAESLAFVRDGCTFISAADRDRILGGTATELLRIQW